MYRTALPFTDRYLRFDYGPSHPFKVSRLTPVHRLMEAYGLLSLEGCLYPEVHQATPEELMLFHDADYVRLIEAAGRGEKMPELRAHGIGAGDNPVFPGLYEWVRLTTGATILCANLLLEERCRIAFNVAGGFHHAFRSEASGFCYVNDVAVGILLLRQRGLRVMYVDVDAHHADGVQSAFYRDPEVLTVCVHQDGATLFPGTGALSEMGEGDGYGFSVNVPLMPHTDDAAYTGAFRNLVPPLADLYRPDVLVSQLGVDTFRTDDLAALDLTTNGFCEVIAVLKSLDKPWLALGGGGYRTSNVARAWTLAWAMMNDVELPDEIPEAVLPLLESDGEFPRLLRDAPFKGESRAHEEARAHAEETVETIRRVLFPVIAAKPRPRTSQTG